MTIIETEFGQRIGGFNPLAWDSSSGYSNDIENKTFLFSLTTNDKLPLSKTSQSVYNLVYNGPSFGAGHDLHISDKSNVNSFSLCNVPYSFKYMSFPLLPQVRASNL